MLLADNRKQEKKDTCLATHPTPGQPSSNPAYLHRRVPSSGGHLSCKEHTPSRVEGKLRNHGSKTSKTSSPTLGGAQFVRLRIERNHAQTTWDMKGGCSPASATSTLSQSVIVDREAVLLFHGWRVAEFGRIMHALFSHVLRHSSCSSQPTLQTWCLSKPR
jgi:hypothetical protein